MDQPRAAMTAHTPVKGYNQELVHQYRLSSSSMPICVSMECSILGRAGFATCCRVELGLRCLFGAIIVMDIRRKYVLL